MNTPILSIVRALACLLVLLAAIPAFGQDLEKIDIVEGKSEVLKIDFVIDKVATGDPEVCRAVKTAEKELLINAQKVGRSNIIIWGPENERRELIVNVQRRDLAEYADELKELLHNVEGVKVKTVGRRIVLEGEVFAKADLEKISKMVADMPEVVNLVELSPFMKKIVKEEIEKALRGEGMSNVKVKVGKDKFILSGTVSTEPAVARAEKIASAFNPDIVNAIQVDTGGGYVEAVLIEMTLNVMELDKNALKDFGIHWNPGGSLGGTGSYSGSTGSKPSLGGSLTGTISNLFPKMRKIKEHGRGRSLMQQSLVTRSGGQADFFAGSEIPVPVAQEGGTMSVEYKKVGVTLNFSPTIDAHNNVNTPVRIMSSSVTGQGAGGAPIINSTQLNTVVSVKSGSSLALGGLIGQKDLESISGSPAGGGFSLYQANRAERRGTERGEVIIFVTPKILASADEAIKEMEERVEDSFKEQELEKLRKQMGK